MGVFSTADPRPVTAGGRLLKTAAQSTAGRTTDHRPQTIAAPTAVVRDTHQSASVPPETASATYGHLTTDRSERTEPQHPHSRSCGRVSRFLPMSFHVAEPGMQLRGKQIIAFEILLCY